MDANAAVSPVGRRALTAWQALAAGLTAILALALLTPVPTSTTPPVAQMVDVIVRAVPGHVARAAAAIRSAGGEVGRPLPVIDGMTATVPASQLAPLRSAPGIGSVTPDGKVQVQSSTWDAAADLGSMVTTSELIEAPYMWERGWTGAGVGIALIDTGVAPVPGLTDGVVHGPDLSFEAASPELRYIDTHGHGTHMAGIIAGRDGDWSPSSATAFAGVAPDATLVSVKVAVANGAADVSQVIAAIDWVVQHRADHDIRVLNLSFGTDGVQDRRLDPLSYAVENAWHKGIVVVAAGGNSGFTGGRLKNPAYNPFVVAVGASDPSGTKPTHDDLVPDWSSRGDGTRNPDLVAPGQSIVSLRNPGGYADTYLETSVVADRFVRASGTSQAAAVTSGAAALLIQQRPDLTPDEVKALLTRNASAMPEADPQAQGSGLLNLKSASRASLPELAAQTHDRSVGLGLLDEARGSVTVEYDGVPLVGELDAGLNLWTPATWTYETSNEVTWSGGEWTGGKWTGGEWAGGKWTDHEWAGGKWTGGKWTGEWAGGKWTGGKWTGGKWTGDAWSWQAGS